MLPPIYALQLVCPHYTVSLDSRNWVKYSQTHISVKSVRRSSMLNTTTGTVLSTLVRIHSIGKTEKVASKEEA